MKPQPPAFEQHTPDVHPQRHPVPYIDAYCGQPKSPANPRGMSLDWCWWTRDDRQGDFVGRCPCGVPGDRLWVRETFAVESNLNVESNEEYPPPFKDGRPVKHTPEDGEMSAYWEQPHYRSTDEAPEFCYENGARKGCKACEEGDPNVHWRPSIFMPRWASRLTLEVKAVRVERLQGISDEDEMAEGINYEECPYFDEGEHLSSAGAPFSGERYSFIRLWDSINAKRGHGWETDPWVWVIEFERVNP